MLDFDTKFRVIVVSNNNPPTAGLLVGWHYIKHDQAFPLVAFDDGTTDTKITMGVLLPYDDTLYSVLRLKTVREAYELATNISQMCIHRNRKAYRG